MIKIAHMVNVLEELEKVPKEYGVEIDLRSCSDMGIILSHDKIEQGKTYLTLDHFLQNYDHNFIIANIKESGIEIDVINKIKKFTDKFFLLDIEFPFIISSNKKYKEHLSIRYSEYESIETVKKLKDYVNWVWIDTFSKLPVLDKDLSCFKSCLVSPCRWGRQEDIAVYKEVLNSQNFNLDAVMAELDMLDSW